MRPPLGAARAARCIMTRLSRYEIRTCLVRGTVRLVHVLGCGTVGMAIVENCAEYGHRWCSHTVCTLRSVEFASAGGSELPPVVMDFTPVPPGTLPAQALTLRGPDPDLVLSANDSFVTALGGSDALHATACVARVVRTLSDTRHVSGGRTDRSHPSMGETPGRHPT